MSPRLGGGPLRVVRRILGPESQIRHVKTAVSSCQRLKERGWYLHELAACGFTADEMKRAFGPLSLHFFPHPPPAAYDFLNLFFLIESKQMFKLSKHLELHYLTDVLTRSFEQTN